MPHQAKSLPPVYVTIRDDPQPGQPVADVEIRHGDRVFKAALFAGRSDSGKEYLRGTARPASFEDKLQHVFAASQNEATEPADAEEPAEAGNKSFTAKPGQVWLFYNKAKDRPHPDGKAPPALSGYWGHNDTGERLRVSVWMTGSVGTGKLQTEDEFEAAMASRQADGQNHDEGSGPGEPIPLRRQERGAEPGGAS